MKDFASILDGVEANLELMRELGVRTVEMDRSVLAEMTAAPPPPKTTPPPKAPATPERRRPATPEGKPPATAPAARAATDVAPPQGASPALLAFLHDAPLSEAGADMMGKIVAKLEGNSSTMPVVHSGGLPEARGYVVLGARALAKWFPRMSGAPGDRKSDERGRKILITYSPAYILRFPVVTPGVKKVKLAMWNAIKSICSEARQGK